MEINVLASGSKGNAYRISDGETALLLDAGIPIKQIQASIGFTLSSLSAALITHRHNDHCKAVPELIKAGIDVYASEDVFSLKGIGGHHCKSYTALKAFQVGTMAVIPFECEHDVPNHGFVIVSSVTKEQLLYFTDTCYLPLTFPGCHYIMGECNYSTEAIRENVDKGIVPASMMKRIVKTHMGIETFLDMLRANDLSKIKRIYLLHLSDSNSREGEFKRAVQEIAGCEVYVC